MTLSNLIYDSYPIFVELTSIIKKYPEEMKLIANEKKEIRDYPNIKDELISWLIKHTDASFMSSDPMTPIYDALYDNPTFLSWIKQ